MNIDELTIEEAKKLMNMLSFAGVDAEHTGDAHWRVGENYLICTVTRFHIGTLISVTEKELILKNASWIADTGRFEQCIKEGILGEVEPFPDNELVMVGRGALVDAVRWNHELPRKQK